MKSNQLNPKYITPAAFQRFMNEIEGIKIGSNTVYRELQEGKIRSMYLAGAWQIPSSECIDYPERLLQESKGIPAAHSGLLGTKVNG